VPDRGARINPKTGLLAVARTLDSWLIVGTDISMVSPTERNFASRWEIAADSDSSWTWVQAQGLHEIEFERRRDALRALTALHQDHPLPAVPFHRGPALRRDPDHDVWVSGCGHYIVTYDPRVGMYRLDADGARFPRPWHATLRMARHAIAESQAEYLAGEGADV